MTTPTDPRIAPVEHNLLEFFRQIVAHPGFGTDGHDDVGTYHSDVAFPLFNGIADARFAPGTEEQRAREVLAAYVERGLPFLWWTTPSTSSPELERALVEAGLVVEPTPGMYADLSAAAAAPAGIELRVVPKADHDLLATVLVTGFEMPDDLAPAIQGLLAPFDRDRLVSVLARVDGEYAGCGSLWITGETAGLYNIATIGRFRGRGLGLAVTAALMELGRERGCTHAVLHASEMGRPVYERLGFVEVCGVPQYVGIPSP